MLIKTVTKLTQIKSGTHKSNSVSKVNETSKQESDEIYIAVIAPDNDDFTVSYKTSLPIETRGYDGFNVVNTLAKVLEGEPAGGSTEAKGETALDTYLGVTYRYDREIIDAGLEGGSSISWLSELKNQGYEEFFDEIERRMEQEGKANLLGSFTELTEKQLEEELEKYSWELEWQGERKPGERTF